MVSRTKVIIVSSVLGTFCAALVIILLYLLRAVKKKSVRRDEVRSYHPGIIIRGDIPDIMPITQAHKVQVQHASPTHKSYSADHLDSSYSGISRYFDHKGGEQHQHSSISVENLNTPISSPTIRVRRKPGTCSTNISLPSSPTFSQRHRGMSDPPSPYKLGRSYTQSSSSEVCGKLEFSYYFDEKNRQFHVNVIQALHLPGDETLESYVIAMLKPDDMSWRRETKFVYNSTDPLFNETFLVSGFTHTKIRQCSLHFLVMNNAENKAIGQLHVPLADLQPNKITNKCLSLSPMVSDALSDSDLDMPPLGELLISLSHNPSEGKLTVGIKSCKSLPPVTKSGKVDPYIKIRVFFCGERIYKKKTSVKHDTKSPLFDEAFDFVVTRDKMPQTSIILRIYHHGRRANVLNKSVLIGVVFLGYQFELYGNHPYMLDYGARHWASVIEKPHLQIEEWHPIQPFSR